MADNNVINRELFGFADEVKTRFSFLESFGFRCVRFQATLVRFKSSKFAINIYNGQQSYEVGLEIECPQTLDTYSCGEILRLIDSEQAKYYRNYAAHTVEGVAEGVRQLANLFKKCIDTGVLNDSKLFSRLKMQRTEIAESYALEVQLEQAHKITEDAWAKKDFKKVVNILSPLKNHLNPSDLKKVEYAKKQISY